MKHFFNFLLAAAVTLNIVSGCQAKNGEEYNKEQEIFDEKTTSALNIEGTNGFTGFDSTLINFVEQNGYEKENFMISPVSFRAALTLAAAGADGETKKQLLTAMGFENIEQANEWYAGVLAEVEQFDNDLQEEIKFSERFDFAKIPDRAYNIANSVWHNTDSAGTLNEEYISYVKENYNAEANQTNSKNITESINAWVNEQTDGMIKSISDNMSDVNTALVNALYLRTSWVNTFNQSATEKSVFTDIDGQESEKDFMNQTDSFQYYEDDGTQLLIMPMCGGVYAAFVLGNTDNILEKIENAQYEQVAVKLPKFEIESSFSNRELVNYLINQGAVLPFDGNFADFSAMCSDSSLYIDDIIQKTKIKTDEDGIEAAAATAITMKLTDAYEPQTAKKFTADKPFSFYICSSFDDDSELLFYGQYVK